MGNIINKIENNGWIQIFLLNWFFSLIILEWALTKFKPLKVVTKMNKEFADKYPAFIRNDINKIRRVILYLLAPFTYLRFAFGWFSIMLLCLWCNVLLFNHNRKDPIPAWKKPLIKFACRMSANCVLLSFSVMSLN